MHLIHHFRNHVVGQGFIGEHLDLTHLHVGGLGNADLNYPQKERRVVKSRGGDASLVIGEYIYISRSNP